MAQSPRLGRLWATDAANGGIADIAEPCPEPWSPKRGFFLRKWCDEHDIHLVVVGPEGPLAEGIADELATDDRRVFGPGADGARIEADKAFAKDVMRQASIPTAEARVFGDHAAAQRYLLRGIDDLLERDDDREAAAEVRSFIDAGMGDESPFVPSQRVQAFLESHVEPCVVKASGLAAGKGVIVCRTSAEALASVANIMEDRAFGDAGNKVLVEEYLEGQEVSVLALVDGSTIWVLDACQDHKQVGEGDIGPNTGGMGAYCPAPILDADGYAQVEREVLVPAVDALRREGIDYRGLLYVGLMLTPGGPKVLEFNCRFGDPECQPLMARLQGDLIDILWRTADGTLDGAKLSFDDDVACCVVMCSEGYPGAYEKGRQINGVSEAESADGVEVFHAGTMVDGQTLRTSGGRVLGVTARGSTLADARDGANEACRSISFEGAFWRSDIGCRVLGHVATTTAGGA